MYINYHFENKQYQYFEILSCYVKPSGKSRKPYDGKKTRDASPDQRKHRKTYPKHKGYQCYRCEENRGIHWKAVQHLGTNVKRARSLTILHRYANHHKNVRLNN